MTKVEAREILIEKLRSTYPETEVWIGSNDSINNDYIPLGRGVFVVLSETYVDDDTDEAFYLVKFITKETTPFAVYMNLIQILNLKGLIIPN